MLIILSSLLVFISAFTYELETAKSLVAATATIIRNVYIPATTTVHIHGGVESIDGQSVYSIFIFSLLRELQYGIVYIISDGSVIITTGTFSVYNIFLIDSYEGFRY